MKRLVQLIGAVAVAAAVAGCSVVNQAGAAAVVGSERMTTDEVAAQFEEIKAALGSMTIDATPADINRQIVSSFIMGEVVDAALAEAGVVVPDSAVAAQRQQLLARFGSEEALASAAAQSAIAPSQIDRALKLSLAYEYLVKHFTEADAEDPDAAAQSAERKMYALITRMSNEAPVTLSPRYGTWDAENTFIVAGSTSDVLVTLDQLAALAQAQQ